MRAGKAEHVARCTACRQLSGLDNQLVGASSRQLVLALLLLGGLTGRFLSGSRASLSLGGQLV